mmetsp:Transcript_91429/g.254619  ORF Transcript_91429/g.254619 Transcript_91429/m.254619 type:complete len:325 (+) Transcript_91429:568-1542(+)
MRPEVVPTTTQPTSPEGAASSLSRQALLTAKDSTCSLLFFTLWSQSLEILQVSRGLKASWSASSPCFAGARGHCASRRPRACRTTTRQLSSAAAPVQTTLMSFRAWPSRAAHGARCPKCTPSTWFSTRPGKPCTTGLGTSSRVRAAAATCAEALADTIHESCPLYTPRSSATTRCMPVESQLSECGTKPEWLGHSTCRTSPPNKRGTLSRLWCRSAASSALLASRTGLPLWEGRCGRWLFSAAPSPPPSISPTKMSAVKGFVMNSRKTPKGRASPVAQRMISIMVAKRKTLAGKRPGCMRSCPVTISTPASSVDVPSSWSTCSM